MMPAHGPGHDPGRSGRGTTKTLGGTRLSPIAQALDEEIERSEPARRGLSKCGIV